MLGNRRQRIVRISIRDLKLSANNWLEMKMQVSLIEEFCNWTSNVFDAQDRNLKVIHKFKVNNNKARLFL